MKYLTILGVATLAFVGVVGVTSLDVSALNGNENGAGMQYGMQKRDGTGNGGGRQASLESRAGVLGMTGEELSEALKTKTMSQIAVERGMSEDTFRAKMTEAAQARWQARGLSEDQVAERVAEREARHAANADHEFGSGEGERQGRNGR